MGFFSLVLANIFGRMARSLLTISGMAVAICAVVALVGIAKGFQKSLRDLYEDRGIDLLVLQSGKVQQTSSVLPMTLVDKIAALPGVDRVAPALSDVVSLDSEDLVAVPVQGWPNDSFLLDELKIIEGRRLEPADAAPRIDATTEAGEDTPAPLGGLMIGKALAKATNKAVGDTLDVLEESPFTIVGIFESYNVFENGSIVLPLAALQDLMLRDDEVTAIAVVAKQHDEDSVSELQQRIQSLGPALRANATREFAENLPEMKMTESVAWLTSSIALIVGSIGMLNTMLMAVFERTREIAMLRAIGWRRWRIVSMILGESVVLAVVGAVIGCVAAVLLTRSLASLPQANGLVSGDISQSVLVQGFVLAMIVGLLGGLYPAIRAARLLPVEGLRHD